MSKLDQHPLDLIERDVIAAAGVGVGGAGCSGCPATNGGNGRVVIQWVSQ